MKGLRGREAVALVARREVTQRLREKSFLISMGVTTVIIVLVAVIPPLLVVNIFALIHASRARCVSRANFFSTNCWRESA